MTADHTTDLVASGDPADDSRAFRRCLGQYATGVTIVTAHSGGQDAGVTANSFASVSMDPPLVLWSLQKNSTSYDIFMSATHFAINVLSSNQIELSQRFAKSGPDKFSGVDFEPGAGKAPVLPGACAVLECRREVEHEGGDHVVMIGRVERYAHFDRPTLVFEKGRYAAAMEHPSARMATASSEGETTLHQYFVVLLNRAYNKMSQEMESARRDEHLDRNEARVLSAVSAYPDRSLDTIMPITFLEQYVARDALSSLVKKGFVSVGSAHTLSLTNAGRNAMEAVFARTQAVEAQLLSKIAQSDLKTTEQTLRKIIGTDAFS